MIIILNLAALITWGALAVIFDKWWLALFAILFWTTVKRCYIYCDGCGEKGPTANSVDEARAKAHGEGWISGTHEGKTLDYCPKCREKYQRVKQ